MQKNIRDTTLKILAFQGSPRIGGNSDLLLDAFLEGAKEAGASVEKIYLSKIAISPCLECGLCNETGKCVIQDDMRWVYDKIEIADVIVVSSPVFFYNITAYTQALVERAQCYWIRKYILKEPPPMGKEKQGIFFSLGATKGPKLFEGIIRIIRYFFDAIYTKYEGGLFYRGIDKKGDILKHPTAISDAFNLGKAVGERLSPSYWPLLRDLSP